MGNQVAGRPLEHVFAWIQWQRRIHRLQTKVARIFNIYGPRKNDGRVISNFIVQALLGRDITVYDDGSQTRSFCYVDDLIDGLIRLR